MRTPSQLCRGANNLKKPSKQSERVSEVQLEPAEPTWVGKARVLNLLERLPDREKKLTKIGEPLEAI